MRKFILYFLLILLLAAVGTFSYGFYNGKKIRGFVQQLGDIKSRHDFSSQVEEIEKSFRDSGKKDTAAIREESGQFKEKLDSIIRDSELARRETEELGALKMTKSAKNLTVDYFSKVSRQASDLKGIIDYMSQIIEVAAVFGEIGESASLDEMKNLIARAKEKAGAVKTEALPGDLRPSAQNLKEAMNNFLARMEETAALKSENTSELDASYNNFSQKEDEFFSAAKKYIDGMEDLNIIEEKINLDIERLGKIKFSLR
ncbi:MAG: hypothetical protein COZ28_00725 [Candidatus Moranbacteria bacterium CG_4_10_14_3_um_filter_44_15]|nr:MAG: hypothetical protein COS72_04530 [Candidatus Moranbacteria bacterium CG06_land_8_20_14_3_00_43_56]PIV83673.1 MAG: hypothetical protein COW51_03490 [Candidatus Moranbacteria bacterium CG17_big_fil_post_rev_8_21_14_2_50_44_12]PIW93312.1 MAG: hypothetical protein COZ87_01985 [Candidatus Moranbacteria bacterium CG_4_8_14_3_um_filter_43_15]PIX91049.1 MAG: hypothetical protein COZ28_00725 [Candidatus Moranbacteria bacterium CG_4_10_14_3_um_filter_44_15]PJA85690.1 MAG: hypothetical protein CO1